MIEKKNECGSGCSGSLKTVLFKKNLLFLALLGYLLNNTSQNFKNFWAKV